jgi:hypothetical protein
MTPMTAIYTGCRCEAALRRYSPPTENSRQATGSHDRVMVSVAPKVKSPRELDSSATCTAEQTSVWRGRKVTSWD